MSTDKYSRNRQGKTIYYFAFFFLFFLVNFLDLRVLQKNMVYCSGLPSNLTKD